MKDIDVEQLRYFFEKLLFDPVAIDHLLVDAYANYTVGGKLYRNKLVEFLDERNILHTPSDFFNKDKQFAGTADSKVISKQTKQAKHSDITTEKQQIETDKANKRPRRYRKGEITIKEAALLFGVRNRTIQNWDDGINSPHGYPGRGSLIELRKFAFQYQSQKDTRKAVSAMNRASSGNNISSDAADRQAFKEWKEYEDNDVEYEDAERKYETD